MTLNSAPTVVAVVAAKAVSTRVPRKNLREFHDGRSLLEIKIEQLLSAAHISEVYVSSDSPEARQIAEAAGARFVHRDPHLTRFETPWGDVIDGILQDVPVPPETFIAWCPITSPLFTRYDEAIDMLGQGDIDSVISVTRDQRFFLSSEFQPINYQWGVWHPYSQNLKPLHIHNTAISLARKADILRNRYLIGEKPGFLITDTVEGIDIDTMDEFEMAQFFYGKRFAQGGPGAKP